MRASALLCGLDGMPKAAALLVADIPEREAAQLLLGEALHGGETIVVDRGYAGAGFAAAVAELGAVLLRSAHLDEPGRGPHLALIRQRIETVFWRCKDLVCLERQGARTPRNRFVRVGVRLLALAAAIALNRQLGRPSRALVDYTA